MLQQEITEPTPVQQQAIPVILSGKDCLAEAPTGTGKTFAFGIPAIQMLDTANPAVQVVILCPTRELAIQSERELKKLSIYEEGVKILAIYGGQPIERQLAALRKKPQIVVGTPGRVMDHIRRKTLRLNNVKMIILDEADEMLNMGFREDIDTVLESMPKPISTQLFSATMPKEILQISKLYQVEPVYVKALCDTKEIPNITQYYIKTTEAKKFDAFRTVMAEHNYRFVLVFCNTKRRVDELDRKLNENNYLSSALHGDLRQRQRDIVMKSYRDRKINILVATDVAARGIDVADIEAVFNYDLPSNEEYYVHRIGRTARAKKEGVAYTFVTNKDEGQIKYLEKITGTKMEELLLSNDKLSKKPLPVINNTVRFFVNVGQKDGASNKLITEFLEKNAGITPDCVADIKILELFSFIELTFDVAMKIMQINGKKFGGRKVTVEEASASREGKGDSAKKAYGGKKSASKTYGERAQKNDNNSYGESKSYGDKPKGNKKPYDENKPYGVKSNDKKSYGENKSYGDKPKGNKKPYDESKPYGRKPNSEKPYGESKSYGAKSNDKKSYGESKPYGGKPKSGKAYGNAAGAKKSYSDRKKSF